MRDQERYASVSSTIEEALTYGILPIVNENDTITTDKLKVGDNDNLAAMVSAAAQADALVLCTDVDGLYSSNPKNDPNAEHIPVVKSITDKVRNLDMLSTNSVGTGGMSTKVQAAEKAVAHGITTYIIHGERQESFAALLKDENPGTIFLPNQNPLHDKVHWLRYTTRAQGELVVNKSGEKMVVDGLHNVSSEQLVEVNGEFNTGDTVVIKSEEGKSLAKAITNCSSCLMSYLAEHDDSSVTHIDSVFENDHVAMLKEV